MVALLSTICVLFHLAQGWERVFYSFPPQLAAALSLSSMFWLLFDPKKRCLLLVV